MSDIEFECWCEQLEFEREARMEEVDIENFELFHLPPSSKKEMIKLINNESNNIELDISSFLLIR